MASNPSSISTYKIHAINVNSLARVRKRLYLTHHINVHKPDIVLLSETCLYHKNKMYIHDFNFVRTDKTPSTRGTAILLKNTLNYKPFYLPFPTNFEYTAITIKNSSGLLYLFSIYIHQNQLTDTEVFDKIYGILGQNDSILFGGDFNARHTNWQNPRNNQNGETLNNWLTSRSPFNAFRLIPSATPSRITENSESFIDLFLFSDSISSPNFSKAIDYQSDHSAVELCVIMPKFDTIPPPKFLDYSRTKWLLVSKELDTALSSNLPPLNSNISIQDIDNYVEFLENTTLSLVSLHTPEMRINSKYDIKLSELTVKCISIKKKLRRKWFETGRQDFLIKALIKRVSTLINEQIQLSYNQKLSDHLKNMKPGPSLFRQVKNFANLTNRKMPILESCDDNTASATKLASHFSDVHNNSSAALADSQTSPPNDLVSEMNNSPIDPIFLFSDGALADGSSESTDPNYKQFASTSYTKNIIKSRRGQKSCGNMQISNYILKRLPAKFLLFITILINHSFNLSYFPAKWRHATVVPVPKGVSASQDPTQYRPISLLSPISKVYEVFIKDKLQIVIENLKAFNTLQFGFSRGKSTSHAMTYLLQDIHSASFNKLPTLAVTIDLMKAFDTVWANGLIFKMKQSNFPINLMYLVLSFLSNRSFQVKFNDSLSASFPIKAGVPQGSILGPLLFNLSLHDFPIFLDTSIKVLFFADDILLYTSRKNVKLMIVQINKFLSSIQDYLDLWKLVANYGKCQAILFRKSDTHITRSCKLYKLNRNINIRFGSHSIEAVSNVKYLGVIFNCKLSTIPHVDKTHSVAFGAFYALKNVFANRTIPFETKVLCYKQLIRTILTFGFPGWSHVSSHQLLKLRRFERKVLYKCLPYNISHPYSNPYRLLHKSQLLEQFDKMKRLDVILVERLVSFFNKLEFCDIPELARLADIDFLCSHDLLNTDKYKFRCFPPSLLYHLHLQGRIYSEDRLIFYNRRCHSLSLNELVYDVIE